MVFECTEKILSFKYMATLTKYNSFKSLKQNSSVRVQKAESLKNKAEKEMKAFLQLLGKKKVKKT
jgi:hypothetical protein